MRVAKKSGGNELRAATKLDGQQKQIRVSWRSNRNVFFPSGGLPSWKEILTIKNRLLAALPHDEYTRLHPHLEFVQLSKCETLYQADDSIRHDYFLNRGMAMEQRISANGHRPRMST